jgi:hypothetical protein
VIRWRSTTSPTGRQNNSSDKRQRCILFQNRSPQLVENILTIFNCVGKK